MRKGKKYVLASMITLMLSGGMAGNVGATYYTMNEAGAVYDMTGDYAGGLSIDASNLGTRNSRMYYLYTYDAATDTVKGGDISCNVSSKNWYSALTVKARDLPDLKADTVQKVYDALLKKVKASGAMYGNMTLAIVDDDGVILRSKDFAIGYGGNVKFSPTYGGTYRQVLSADGTADQYAITDGTLYVGNYGGSTQMTRQECLPMTIAPDLSTETVKAAVRGADEDLLLRVVNGTGADSREGVIAIRAEGGGSDRVYGIYNDKKGAVDFSFGAFAVDASGSSESNAIYAGNNGDYTSSVKLSGYNYSYQYDPTTLKSTGSTLEAGKNGSIEISMSPVSYESEKGHLLYAHDGGHITATSLGTLTLGDKSKYLAYATNGGTADLGVKLSYIDSVDYTEASYGTYLGNIEGNLKTDDTGVVNFGLSLAKAVYSGNAEGNVNIYLNSGAGWTGAAIGDNVSLNLGGDSTWEVTASGAQHLKSHSGSDSASKRSGILVGSGDITIDKYSGNTTFLYARDAADPTAIIGGNVTIASAEPVKNLSSGVGDVQYMVTTSPSTVYIRTSADGIDTTNEEQVEAVLDNLAKKLTYTAYTTGERNLSGRVEIAEGLTTSALSKEYRNITFDETTGQAKTEGELYKPYSAILFGNETVDAAGYGDVISGAAADNDLTYTFTGDTLIETKVNEDPRSFAMGSLYLAAINNYGEKRAQYSSRYPKGGPSYTIDMQGHDLTVIFSSFPQAGTTGSQPMWTAAAIGAYREGTITIDNPGAISLESTCNYYYGSAIRVSTGSATDTGAHVVINNDNTKEHAVKIRGGIDTPGYQLNWRAIECVTGGTQYLTGGDWNNENKNTVTIKGLVDIDVDYCASLFARGEYATIEVGGGSIKSNAYNSMWTTGEHALINVNVVKDDEGNVTGAGTNYVQVTGDVSTETPYYGDNGTINLGLATSDSFLVGHFYGPGNNNLWLRNGAYWENCEMTEYGWATGTISRFNHDSLITNLYGGETEETAGNIYQKESKTITIDNLYGYTNVYMAHDEENPTNFDALGNVIIKAAHQTDGKNAGISLFTDRSGIDTSNEAAVENVLTALAKKLVYEEAIESDNNPNPTVNLNGHVGISEGLTAGSVAVRLADIGFDSKTGEGVLDAGSISTPEKYIPILYGSTETAMMKGAKSAMAASALLWRAENNDLMKRMGDLRLSPGDTGVWAKYYSGRYQMDAQNTDLSLKYKAYQVGFDKKAGNWIVGAAFSYNDGDASYGTGSADLEAKSFGLYGTWKGKSGQYLDVIAKYSRLDDEYDVYNTSGHKLDGDYKTSGVSLSVEYGRRLERENGFYTEPSVELTFGHIGSKDYSAQSDYLTSVGTKKDMEVHQGGFTTLVGRLGVRVGQKRAHSSYFGKVALAHEFDGGFDSTFRAAGEPEGKTSLDFGGTWLELAVGGTLQLKDSTALYGSVERSFGSDVEEKWRIDAGLRFSF